MTGTLHLTLTREAGQLLFAAGEATFVGGFCCVKLEPGDARLGELAELEQRERIRSGCGVVLGWKIERRYTPSEIESAQLFRLFASRRFEPTGEECGTEYDLTALCPRCGAGRVQRSDLILDLRRLSKGAVIAVSLGNEIVISGEMAEQLIDAEMTGFELRPVRHRVSDSLTEVPSPSWYQLVPVGQPSRVTTRSKFGINPLNDDPAGEFRCDNGHSVGLSLLSEVSIDSSSWDGRDLCVTDALVGYHPAESLIYPEPLLLVSTRFRRLLKQLNAKNVRTEIAHLVHA